MAFERFFHTLHTHPIETNLARLHQVVEHPEDLRVIVGIGRWAVELHQVEHLTFRSSRLYSTQDVRLARL